MVLHELTQKKGIVNYRGLGRGLTMYIYSSILLVSIAFILITWIYYLRKKPPKISYV